MTERARAIWIKKNLEADITAAIAQGRVKFPDHPYTVDWIAGIVMRETGDLIDRYATANTKVELIHTLMKGDYSQRRGEAEKSYHGFGYTQIDIASYPDFVKSGDWKNPLKCFVKSISVLEEKRAYLVDRVEYTQDVFYRAITAAYNCGQGNVAKAYKEGWDVDVRTHQGNYSAEVFRFREIYRSLGN
jgi:hypothetical protein